MDKLQVIYRDIKTLHPYKNNAKKHPKEQIAQIAESIKQFGFVNPVLIDKHNNVVAGHGRCLAAKKLGMKEVPTIKKDSWTEEEVKAFRLIDNKVNESEWDFSLLYDELDILGEDFDMGVFGFDIDFSGETKQKKKVEFEAVEGSKSVKTEHKCPRCGYEW